ncbi:MAG: hypothetical protein ACJ8G4_04445 [Burkholderiales bacterium]
MESESEKPLRLFVNPFAIWTQLAFKTAEAMWATAHAAALRVNAPRVAVIPTADAPAAKPAQTMLASAHAIALRNAKGAALLADAEDAPRKAPVRKASKAAHFKAARARLRSKANGKRRSGR